MVEKTRGDPNIQPACVIHVIFNIDWKSTSQSNFWLNIHKVEPKISRDMRDLEVSEVQTARNRRRRRRYRINLSRHVYNEQEFTESFIKREEYVSSSEFEPSSLAKTFKRHFFPTRCTCKHVFQSWFPIVEWLPGYKVKRDLAHDIAGGLTVAIMHIPQGRRPVHLWRLTRNGHRFRIRFVNSNDGQVALLWNSVGCWGWCS